MADTMQAGRELDAHIQEVVFGATWQHDRCTTEGAEWLRMPSEHGVSCTNRPTRIFAARGGTVDSSLVVHDRCPKYSTDISAAQLVLDKMLSEWGFDCRNWSTYTVGFTLLRDIACHGYYADSDSLPNAICLAALAAVAGESK